MCGGQRASQATLVVKNLPANARDKRDVDSIPESERTPGGGHGNLLQYSCRENPHGQRSLVGYSPWVREESDMTEQLNTLNWNANFGCIIHFTIYWALLDSLLPCLLLHVPSHIDLIPVDFIVCFLIPSKASKSSAHSFLKTTIGYLGALILLYEFMTNISNSQKQKPSRLVEILIVIALYLYFRRTGLFFQTVSFPM